MVSRDITLRELEPQFITPSADTLAAANGNAYAKGEPKGLLFLCPLCFAKNGYLPFGVHSVLCWNLATPPGVEPGPGRWNADTENFDTLTLVGATSSSVDLRSSCGAHFSIGGGRVYWHG